MPKSVFDKPTSMWEKLKGKKSYFVSVAMFLWGGAFALGWIERDTFEAGMGVLTGLLGVAVRHAIANQ